MYFIFFRENPYTIRIGFCERKFPLEDIKIGFENNSNSIGIASKMGICIDGLWIKFQNNGYFEKNDVIGIGLIHQTNGKMECFITLNGKLHGKSNKFLNIKCENKNYS